jgi:branched-subunit amino acid transport protein AzlD
LIRLFINKIKYFISKTSKIKNNLIIDFILISILLVLLISFIVYEYKKNPQEIIKYLTRILNLYLLLYLIFKILKYSYKVTFQLAEQDTINIKDLKE